MRIRTGGGHVLEEGVAFKNPVGNCVKPSRVRKKAVFFC